MRAARVMLTLLLVGVAVFTVSDWQTLGMTIGPTCTVGVQGTALGLEVRGWSSEQSCSAFESETPASYRYHGELTTPVVCQFDIRGARFTVHDEGALKVLGNAACVALRSSTDQTDVAAALAQATATLPPTVAPTLPPPTLIPTVPPTFQPVPTFVPSQASTTLLGCEVGVVGRSAAVTVIGPSPDSACRNVTALLVLPGGAAWYAIARVPALLPAASSAVCHQELPNGTLVVTDTGGQILGSSLCWQLALTDLSSGTRTPACGIQVAGHDATLVATGASAAADCDHYANSLSVPSTWRWVRVDVSAGPVGSKTICRRPTATSLLEVWDTGGATYGSDICGWLGQ